MSEKKTDKGKWFHKLHQLQKRLTRMNDENNHSEEKKEFRKGFLKKIQDKIKSKK